MICHHYKTVFIHIPKNAGQSIEHVFLESIGLTWETRAPLLLRENNNPKLGPPRLAHLKAEDYVSCKYLSQELFDQYFKFTFVRNPWSRLVSIYNYLGYRDKYTLNDFLKKKFLPEILPEMYWFVGPQTDYIFSQSGQLLVDYVGRFETLQQDFDTICRSIGLPEKELPHVNNSKKKRGHKGFLQTVFSGALPGAQKKNPRDSHASYGDYYDDESIDIVAEIYRRDIEMFKYSYP